MHSRASSGRASDPSEDERKLVEGVLREVDTSLGVKRVGEPSENGDAEAAQFWRRAASLGKLKALAIERRRRLFLIAGLKERKYSDEDIERLFAAVEQARQEELRLEASARRRSFFQKVVVLAVCVGIVATMVLLVVSSRQQAIKAQRQAEVIRAAKTLSWQSSAGRIIKRRGPTDSEFSAIPIQNPLIWEGDDIRTSSGTDVLLLPNKARLTCEGGTSFRVGRLELHKETMALAGVHLELQEGLFHWEKNEHDATSWEFSFHRGHLRIKWGRGTIRVDRTSAHIKVAEGETTIQGVGLLAQPLNGLMEAIFPAQGEPIIRLQQ